MRKKLLMINGPMGVGKTTICKLLHQTVHRNVWLDGDWCWMMHPWDFSDSNKKMVIDNITYLLRNFLKNDGFEVIIFNWVLHREEIFKLILDPLADFDFELHKLTLTASAESLRERLLQDRREETVIAESIARLALYEKLDTQKIDTSSKTPQEIVAEIIRVCGLEV